jgi:hypothetical protein
MDTIHLIHILVVRLLFSFLEQIFSVMQKKRKLKSNEVIHLTLKVP